eukprot:9948096-Alexandrium_andersonii.AAC.1
MDTAAKHDNVEAVRLAAMNEEQKEQSKAVWHLLAQLVGGRALNLLKQSEKHNGLMAWRAIVRAYAPEASG